MRPTTANFVPRSTPATGTSKTPTARPVPGLADAGCRSTNMCLDHPAGLIDTRGHGWPFPIHHHERRRSGMAVITGNTFPVKDQLRALGGRWDAAAKAWVVRTARPRRPVSSWARLAARPANPAPARTAGAGSTTASTAASASTADRPGPNRPSPEGRLVLADWMPGVTLPHPSGDETCTPRTGLDAPSVVTTPWTGRRRAGGRIHGRPLRSTPAG